MHGLLFIPDIAKQLGHLTTWCHVGLSFWCQWVI